MHFFIDIKITIFINSLPDQGYAGQLKSFDGRIWMCEFMLTNQTKREKLQSSLSSSRKCEDCKPP